MDNKTVLLPDIRSKRTFRKNDLIAIGELIAHEGIHETEVAAYVESLFAINDAAHIAKYGAPVEPKFNYYHYSFWNCITNPVFWIYKFRGHSLPSGFVFRYERPDVAELRFVRSSYSIFSVYDKKNRPLGCYFIAYNFISNYAGKGGTG